MTDEHALRIEYEDEAVFAGDPKRSLLELALDAGVPHVHACGGHGRCSTCRVLVLGGAEHLTPRSGAEEQLASHKGLEQDVRLACQARAEGPVRVRRLVRDAIDAEVAIAERGGSSGREAPVTVLFADIRDFTPFAEGNLAYDVVHVLNRYFSTVGHVVLSHGGYIDKYLGDGLMALFGLEADDPAAPARAAVAAGLEMLERVETLNVYLEGLFDTRFRIGVGIHTGEAVIGNLGHPDNMQFSAIGDTVNLAARIESATKEHGARLLVSDATYELLRKHVRAGRSFDSTLKGRSERIRLHEILEMRADRTAAVAEETRSARLRVALWDAIRTPQAAPILRLAFHDAFGWDPATGRGGANGSIRLPEELARAENAGLEPAVRVLEPVHAELGDVSWADVIANAGALAVERTGGPRVEVGLGRRDADEPSPPAPSPGTLASFEGLFASFAACGFSLRDLVALSGAHTLGRAEGRPFTADLFRFSNSYFQALLRDPPDPELALLASDRALLADPEAAALVREYATSEPTFFHDFASAYRRLAWLGVT